MLIVSDAIYFSRGSLGLVKVANKVMITKQTDVVNYTHYHQPWRHQYSCLDTTDPGDMGLY